MGLLTKYPNNLDGSINIFQQREQRSTLQEDELIKLPLQFGEDSSASETAPNLTVAYHR